jgi:hypothetical protein
VPAFTVPYTTYFGRRENAISATGVDVFAKTLQTTNNWLDDIVEDMGPHRQLAWNIL